MPKRLVVASARPAALALAALAVAGAGTAAVVTRAPATLARPAGQAAAPTLALRTLTPPAGVAAEPARPRPPRSAAAAPRPNTRVLPVSRSRPRPRPVPPVAPLRRLLTPDVQVDLPASASPAGLAALRAVDGVAGVAVLDVGTVRTYAGRRQVVGVNPSVFRAFTPRLTAASDPLWRSVAAGELTVGFSAAGPLRRDLGRTLRVVGSTARAVRIGAFAALGLPGTDALVTDRRSAQLGLRPATRLLVAAPQLPVSAIEEAVRAAFGPGATVRRLRPQAFDQSRLSDYAAGVIPAGYLRLYRAAATTCPGLPWTVLAAIGAVETGHGANTAVSSAGAMGPMQFLPSTFRAYGVDGNGDGIADINDPADAVYSAARYLCAEGAGRGGQALYDAIFAYNRADWYVRQVVALAIRYQ